MRSMVEGERHRTAAAPIPIPAPSDRSSEAQRRGHRGSRRLAGEVCGLPARRARRRGGRRVRARPQSHASPRRLPRPAGRGRSRNPAHRGRSDAAAESANPAPGDARRPTGGPRAASGDGAASVRAEQWLSALPWRGRSSTRPRDGDPPPPHFVRSPSPYGGGEQRQSTASAVATTFLTAFLRTAFGLAGGGSAAAPRT